MFRRGDEVIGGRYRIEAPAGEGKAGPLFDASRVADGLPVTIRSLAPSLRNQAPVMERLRQRAEFAAGLSHPNLVPVLEVSEAGTAFMTAERRFDALPLLRVVRGKGACSPYEAAWIAGQLSQGVDYLIASGTHGFDFTLSDVYAEIGDLRREEEFFSMTVDRWPNFSIRLNPLALNGDRLPERIMATWSDPALPLVQSMARIVFNLVTGGMGDPLAEPVISEKFTASLRACLTGSQRSATCRDLLWTLFGDFGDGITRLFSVDSPLQEQPPMAPPPPLPAQAVTGAAPDPAALNGTPPPSPLYQALPPPPAKKKKSGSFAIIALLLVGVAGGGFAFKYWKDEKDRKDREAKKEDTPAASPQIAATEPKKEPGQPPVNPMPPETGVAKNDPDPKPPEPPPVEEKPVPEGLRDYRLTKRAEVEVQAVYFLQEPNRVSGGTSPLTIRAEGNSSGQARIGLKREMLGGTGQMWDGSVWVAAFVASQSLGQSVIDNEFEVISTGSIDGPSAGMLITTVMTALMTGEPLKPDTTMTGTVNPDGTCGPVGGIIQKLEGAAAKGIKRFGYPAGNRLIMDPNKGALVDVKARGTELGIETEEISTLAEAYLFFTGKIHPSMVGMDDAAKRLPDVDVSLLNRLRGSREQIASRVVRAGRAALPDLERLDPQNQKSLRERIDLINEYLHEAELKERKGAFALSLYQTANALAAINQVEIDIRMIEASGNGGGFAGAIAKLDEIDKEISLDRTALGRKVTGYLTTADLSSRIDALSLAAMLQEVEIQQVTANQNLRLADQLVRDKITDAGGKKRVQRLINQASSMLSYAKGRLESAESWQSISFATGKAEIATDKVFFDQQGKSYALAAESSLELLKSVASERWRTASKQQFGEASVNLPDSVWAIEPSFHSAEIAAKLTLNRRMTISRAGPTETEPVAGTGVEGASIDVFGSGIYSYLEVAKMMLTWYNFPEIQSASADNTAYSVAFGNFLEAARINALAKARRAEAVCGRMPESILLNLHLGSQLANGSVTEKMAGFVAFWKTSLYSDVVIAAGKSAQQAPKKNVEEAPNGK